MAQATFTIKFNGFPVDVLAAVNATKDWFVDGGGEDTMLERILPNKNLTGTLVAFDSVSITFDVEGGANP